MGNPPITAKLCLFVCAFALSTVAANAKPRHQRQAHTASQGLILCPSDQTYRQTCGGSENRIQSHRSPAAAYAEDAQIVAHPEGCPRRLFCGCGVSVKVFGKPVRDLFLAANWKRKFPRAAPGAGMVAARNGHVFYIMSYLGDGQALAYDPNSGGRKTRIHVRSLAGYVVVNPHARVGLQ